MNKEPTAAAMRQYGYVDVRAADLYDLIEASRRLTLVLKERRREWSGGVSFSSGEENDSELESALQDLFETTSTLGSAKTICDRCNHLAHPSDHCQAGQDPPSYDICGCSFGYLNETPAPPAMSRKEIHDEITNALRTCLAFLDQMRCTNDLDEDMRRNAAFRSRKALEIL